MKGARAFEPRSGARVTDPSPRKNYATKAEWAAAQATELRSRIRELRYRSSGGSTARARRKYESIAHMEAEAARFESIAARFRERGE